MATCTLKLYANTKIKPQKNFVIDDIASYLATISDTLTISAYQYQRFELYKKIKVNLSQEYQDTFASTTKWDYLSIETTSNSVSSFHYYFIKSYRQVAQSTIELDIEMDTINTFNFVSSIDDSKKNIQYTLDKKSIINREHKDRLRKKTFQYTELFEVGSDSQDYISQFDSTFWGFKSTPQQQLIGASVVSYSYQMFPESGTANPVIRPNIINISNTGVITFNAVESGNFATVHIRCQIYITYTITRTLRIIDRYQEGIDTYLFKTSEKELLDADRYKTYYLIYSSSNNVVSAASDTNAIYVNPVRIGLCESERITVATKTISSVTIMATDERIPKVRDNKECIIIKKTQLTGGNYVVINGTTYTSTDFPTGKDAIAIGRNGNNDIVFEGADWGVLSTNYEGTPVIRNTVQFASNFDSVTFYGVDSVEIWAGWYISADYGVMSAIPYSTLFVGAGANATSDYVIDWKSMDLTEPKLIKAINYPYCPNEWLVGKGTIDNFPSSYSYNATDKRFELANAQDNDFDRQIYFNADNPIKKYVVSEAITSGITRNDVFESKLYHSDFFQAKFVYDSFGFAYHLENIDVDEYVNNYNFEDFIVRYVVSGNVLSKFMFQFIQYICDRSIQDYENVLIIDRNNEKALYNSAYINYIKSGGFSYDTKKANSQNAMNGLTTALSLVGAVASFAGGVASHNPMLAVAGVGLATTTIMGIARSIHTAQEQDRAISQKLLQNANQGMTVQGSEDIDILKAFTNNKAKMCYYEPSAIMKQAIADLFYYCGYATHEQKVPNVKTRRYFNYVQADILLDEYTFNEDIANKIIDKWKEGITFIHKVSSSWNIDQTLENFEISIL